MLRKYGPNLLSVMNRIFIIQKEILSDINLTGGCYAEYIS